MALPQQFLNKYGQTITDDGSGATGPVAPFGVPVDPNTAATPPTIAPNASITNATGGTPPANPQGGQAQSGSTAQPNANGTSPLSSGGSNPFALSQAMSALQGQITNNNSLVDQKNLILQQMYGVPLTDAQKAKLDPGLASVLNSGDRNAMDFNLRLLNDQIAGRTNTLDQSVQTLTSGYNTAVQQAETAKQNAISNVQNFVTQYGSNAGSALQALYGPDYVNQLAAMGINLPGFEAAAGTLPTINQQRYAAQYGFTGSSSNVGGYDLSSYATNPNYASNVSSIASTIGPVTDANGANTAIQSIAPGSPITGQMVMNSAQQYGVDPTVLMSVMQADTKMGTDGSFGSRVNNFGDVGVNDTLAAKINAGTATPAEIAGVTMTPQGGVDAVAKWLAAHPANQSAIQNVAQGIVAGTLPPPPMSSRPTQYMINLENELSQIKMPDGTPFNLTKATEEWSAVQKSIATGNSAQQVRLRQAVTFSNDSLDVIDQLNDVWNGGNFPALNKIALEAAVQGVDNAPLPKPIVISVPDSSGGPGTTETIKDKQTLATLLEAQISDITSELGTVYKAGFSSTDDSLALAKLNASPDWSHDQLQGALAQVRTNLMYRKNSITATGPIVPGQTDANPYVSSSPGGTSAQAQTTPSGFSYTISP